jgi:hypothetical protein
MPIPSNIDAERALLGALIVKPDLPWPPGLLPSHFFDPTHADIAAAVIKLDASGIQRDEMTVGQTLAEAGSPVTPHAVEAITNGADFRPYSPAWADQIARAHRLRLIQSAASKAVSAASDTAADPDVLLDFLEGTAKSISRSRTKSGPQRMDLDDLDAFDRKADPDSVLGNRWLCKGGSLLIVGQSGTGKSSLMMQAAVSWAVGRDFFGIRAKRPLRIVILQAENDRGDVAEAFQDCVHGMNLHQNQRDLLADNLAIYRDTTSTGQDFTAQLKDLITANQADLVFVDPLLSFAGIDVSDQEQASRFLRHDLAPILLETGAVLVAMHHTGKPKSAADKEGQTVADLAYAGLGSSEFTNYFREVAVLFRCQGDQPVYKFGLTKRRGRAGLQNAAGQFAGDILVRHSRTEGVIRWEYAVPEETDPQPQTPSQSSVKGSPRHRNIV